MIIVTGGAGFIGSVLVGYLNKKGYNNILIFDDMPVPTQFHNLIGKNFISIHSTDEMPESGEDIDFVIHLGANSNTLEKNWSDIYQSNVLSTRLWNQFCRTHKIPMIFASSAAVYGNGRGPLNQYAFSKCCSEMEISSAVILRLFNVYGPNEYHKGRMASTILHWNEQYQTNHEIEIFNSSEQYKRDFIYVEDVVSTIYYFMEHYQPDTYDIGTGRSTSFKKIASYIGSSLKFIPMPEDLEKQYQTDTKANVANLKRAGVDVDKFMTPDQGIATYLAYLNNQKYY
jgi:ADP-L-glycero-D-manno-heptose 6-epimerase